MLQILTGPEIVYLLPSNNELPDATETVVPVLAPIVFTLS